MLTELLDQGSAPNSAAGSFGCHRCSPLHSLVSCFRAAEAQGLPHGEQNVLLKTLSLLQKQSGLGWEKDAGGEAGSYSIYGYICIYMCAYIYLYSYVCMCSCKAVILASAYHRVGGAFLGVVAVPSPSPPWFLLMSPAGHREKMRGAAPRAPAG